MRSFSELSVCKDIKLLLAEVLSSTSADNINPLEVLILDAVPEPLEL